MTENICTILLNRTLNKETDDAPIGTIEGDEYYLDVKNGLKKWEQYIDIATTGTSDKPNNLYIDSYLYLKIRDDLEYQLVYADLFLLRHDNSHYYPLNINSSIDQSKPFTLQQIDEGKSSEDETDTPVESKYGITNNGEDKLIVTCTVNGSYLIRYVSSGKLYILSYIIHNNQIDYSFVSFDNFKNYALDIFDEYGLYRYEDSMYGLFWNLRNNSLRPAINRIVSLILQGNGNNSEYEFKLYSGETIFPLVYKNYVNLFKTCIYDNTEEINGVKPTVQLYPLYFNKEVSMNYIPPIGENIDQKYLVHASANVFQSDSYELYKHNWYIEPDTQDTSVLKSEVPQNGFRIIESFPCDFNRFNIKITPMWDSELDANPVAIELSCILKNKDKSILDLLINYIYHKNHDKESADYAKPICEKVDKDALIEIEKKNKIHLLHSELTFFLNDDAFKISDLSSVEITVTPVMIFGPLYDLSKVITIETDKINTNTIELSIYKYYYDKNRIVLTYNIELYLDANATIYNDANDQEHCPHCYITKLSDFIANGYKTDKEKGIEIEEISKSLLSSVYNTVNIPLDEYIVSTEIYVIEFCMYIHHLGSFIKRSLFRIMNTTEMFNSAFLDGRMVYSDGLVVENVNDFQLLYLDPGDKYVFVLMFDGRYVEPFKSDCENLKYIISQESSTAPSDKTLSKIIKLTAPTFADDDAKAKFSIQCGVSNDGKTFPYSFNVGLNNNQEYIYKYYDEKSPSGEAKDQYTFNYDYQYHEVDFTLSDDVNAFNNTKLDYLFISLMQYGCFKGNLGLFGINWKQNPTLRTCGAFNVTSYGWDGDSNYYLSYIYDYDTEGKVNKTQWNLLEHRGWSGDYITLFKLTNCPSNREFVPMYVCGTLHGTEDKLDGDGRINYVDNTVLPSRYDGYNWLGAVSGYGNKSHSNSPIPVTDTGTLWYDKGYRDYQGLIIWRDNARGDIQTGIWFALLRDTQKFYIKTDSSDEIWASVNSNNLAHVIAAKLSQYYFTLKFGTRQKMEDIYNHTGGLLPKNHIFILNGNASLSLNLDVNIKLKLFAKLKYNNIDLIKLLPVVENNITRLYRFVNINKYIVYNNINLYDVKDKLVNSLSGDIDNTDNILNNLFFNNLVNNAEANRLLQYKSEGETDNQFINTVLDSYRNDLVDSLYDYSLFYEYDLDLNYLPILNFKDGLIDEENNSNVLCVYPDGHFSVTIYDKNSIKESPNLYYCTHKSYDLKLAYHAGTLHDALTDIVGNIQNVGRYAYINRDDQGIRCTVIPKILYFYKDDNTLSFSKSSQDNFLWNNGCGSYYVRNTFDLANGTIDTGITGIFRNVIHPI